MEEYISINGILLKQENNDEAEHLVRDYLKAREGLCIAVEKVIKTQKAILAYKPIYSLQGDEKYE